MPTPKILLIDRASASGKLLHKYTQRIDWSSSLDRCNYFTEVHPLSTYDLAIVCLPPPNEPVDTDWLVWLASQPAIILTSAYPQNLYKHLNLNPIAFLTEPIAFSKFQTALHKFLSK